jgi:hypothetical protein
MRTILRGVVGILIVVAALFLIVNYSEYSTTYECSGTMTKAQNTSGPTTIFVKLTQYRWAIWNPFNGLLRWENAAGSIPAIPNDDPYADRGFKIDCDGYKPAPLFPGLFWANGREDLFGIKRVDTFLMLYRWPKAGETVDLTKSGQGEFSTISNFLTFNLSNEATFIGTCTSKNN